MDPIHVSRMRTFSASVSPSVEGGYWVQQTFHSQYLIDRGAGLPSYWDRFDSEGFWVETIPDNAIIDVPVGGAASHVETVFESLYVSEHTRSFRRTVTRQSRTISQS